MRRELYGEGVPVRTAYPNATSTPVMESPKAGAAQAFEYDPPESVSDATAAAPVEAILDGSRTILLGGQPRLNLNATNREDPSTVDRMLAERQPLLENAVEAHTGI